MDTPSLRGLYGTLRCRFRPGIGYMGEAFNQQINDNVIELSPIELQFSDLLLSQLLWKRYKVRWHRRHEDFLLTIFPQVVVSAKAQNILRKNVFQKGVAA